MNIKTLFIYLTTIMLFIGCKKDTKVEEKPIITHSPSNIVKQFNFKNNSKWIFKNTISNSIDTMWVWTSTGLLSTTYKTSKTDYEIIEYFQVNIEHTLLPASWRDIRYSGYESGIVAGDKWGSIEMGLGFFEKNIGDSILYNNTTWNKIENIYPSLLVNGITYSNVYEISYHPIWYGFTKIWWCPTIGFVKLEGTNHVNNQFGIWELQSHNVTLY
jgi:hypothetical protein